jgi:transcriptional regulator with XRE-family HTH domain
MSKASLLEKLTDQNYRQAFVAEEIDTGLPMQIRAMRESRGWKQKDVAEQTGTKQSRFSLMEKPGYGKYSLNTLKKIASIFDVGLIVSFVPFGEMIDFTNAISNRRLAIPSFVQEYPRLEKRYRRGNRETVSTGQEVLNFTASTVQSDDTYQQHSTATYQVFAAPGTSTAQEVVIDVDVPYWISDGDIANATNR